MAADAAKAAAAIELRGPNTAFFQFASDCQDYLLQSEVVSRPRVLPCCFFRPCISDLSLNPARSVFGHATPAATDSIVYFSLDEIELGRI